MTKLKRYGPDDRANPLHPLHPPGRRVGRPIKKLKPGPKPSECPDLGIVRRAAEEGMRQDQIAHLLGFSLTKLKGLEARFPELLDARRMGKAKNAQEDLVNLNEEVRAKKPWAIMFKLERVHGFNAKLTIDSEDKEEVELVSEDQAKRMAEEFLEHLKTKSLVSGQKQLTQTTIKEAEIVVEVIPKVAEMSTEEASKLGLSRVED